MRRAFVVGVVAAFLAGVVVGVAASVSRSEPSLYTGKAPKDAANSLLEVALGQAGKGSWERIGVARVYYLMGDKARAEEILASVTAGKMKGNDWMRIGRLYEEGGAWDKAKDAFDRALALDPKDDGYAAEVGAYYNLHGDRARAEELFAKSFSLKADEVWNTVNAAGSYVGARPQ